MIYLLLPLLFAPFFQHHYSHNRPYLHLLFFFLFYLRYHIFMNLLIFFLHQLLILFYQPHYKPYLFIFIFIVLLFFIFIHLIFLFLFHLNYFLMQMLAHHHNLIRYLFFMHNFTFLLNFNDQYLYQIVLRLNILNSFSIMVFL